MAEVTLKNEVEGLLTLEEVVRWAQARVPPARVANVVAQDEYTHDVVVQVDGSTVLVFDTT